MNKRVSREREAGLRGVAASIRAHPEVLRCGFFDPTGTVPADLLVDASRRADAAAWLTTHVAGECPELPRGVLALPVGPTPLALLVVETSGVAEDLRPVVAPLAAVVSTLLTAEQGVNEAVILGQLVQNYPFGAIVLYDTDYRYVAVGGVDLQKVGLDPERMKGRTAQEVFPEVFDQIAEPYRCALAGKVTQTDVRYRDEWYATSNGPIRDAEGRVVGGMTVTSRITEARNAEMALRESQRLLEESQAVGGVGSWSVQLDTGQLRWTRAGAQVHGFETGQAPETLDALVETIAPEARQWLRQMLEDANAAGPDDPPCQVEVWTEEERWMRIRARRSEKEASTELVALSLDITETKRFQRDHVMREVELEQAKARAEAGEKAKTEFLAVMSHEMRTPLHGVIASATLLRDHVLGPDEAELLETISSSSEALLNVINDVLDLSKLEHDQLKLDAVAFSVAELVRSSVNIIRPRLEGRPVELLVHIEDGLTDRRTGDVSRLRQVLLNLLGNACKFTSEGRIELLVTGEARLRFEVRDTGIGIPPDRIDRLFEPFSQADASTQRKYGGTGLGLSIIARIADAMEGAAWAESEPGQGSSFFFEAPSTLLAQPGGPEASSGESVQVGALTVLVVDDNPVNRKVAQRMLVRLGHRVELAVNGCDALERMRQARFDLVLMDLQMPQMDGVEATRRARAMEKGHRTTIWALTASALAAERDRCMAAGFDSFLSKPLRLGDLQGALEAWYRARQKAGSPLGADQLPSAPTARS